MTSEFLSDMRFLLFPRCCPGCGRADRILCPACSAAFSLFLSRNLYDHSLSGGPSLQVHSCSLYQGLVRQTILAWKDHGDVELDGPFGRFMRILLYRYLAGLNPVFRTRLNGLCFLPTPSRKESFYKRGRWQVHPLCESLVSACGRVGIRADWEPALTIRGSLRKAVEKSDRRDRSSRLRGHVVVSHPERLRGRPLVLVDDIMTTGSTLRTCHQALEEAGGELLACLTLSMVPDEREPR